MDKNGKGVAITGGLVAALWLISSIGGAYSEPSLETKLQTASQYERDDGYESVRYNDVDDERHIIDRIDAISDHWDEIREYLNGSETIEACSSSSGNCYDLDAEISSGEVEQIYFDNGGYLYFSATIDSDGSASDTDVNGNSWDFSIDMDSSMVDDAVQEWADYNGYEIG